MARKPGGSSKLEAVIDMENFDGSKNSPLGAEIFWIEVCSMVEE